MSNILFLGPDSSPLVDWLLGQKEQVTVCSSRVEEQEFDYSQFDFLISYGYRFIITSHVLNIFEGRAINLHISFLPWNKGADPNFWSFVDDTPKGVTIHLIDETLDTGDIICQKEVDFNEHSETLLTSYDKLQSEIQSLFKANWASIKKGEYVTVKQYAKGTVHKSKDKRAFFNTLPLAWDTPISDLKSAYKTFTNQSSRS